MAVKTIVLRGGGIRKERKAGGAITPGHLVELNASDQFVVHSTAAGNAIAAFAVEAEVFGKDIDTAYASGDQCFVEYLPTGSEVYALVGAGAAAIAEGDYLESAGDGTLRKLATATATTQAQRASVVARALEAVDNSAGGTPARIKVEVL